MANRTAAGHFGDMFRMLGSRKVLTKSQRQLARFLYNNSKEYDFTPDQMQADRSIKKLKLAGPEDLEELGDKDYGPVLSPSSAFKGMVKLYKKSFEDTDENWKKKEIVDSVKKLTSYARSFGVSPDSLGVSLDETPARPVAQPRATTRQAIVGHSPASRGQTSFFRQILPGGVTPIQAGALALGFVGFIYVASRVMSPSSSP